VTKRIIGNDHLPQRFRDIIDSEQDIFRRGASVTNRNSIPDTTEIPIVNPNAWIKIPKIIAVVVDMRGSTKFSANAHPNTTAKAYRLFTGTAVKIFHECDAQYIDVKGDGVFSLFDESQVYTALAAAVTFKTFCQEIFIPEIKDVTSLDVGVRIGIDAKSVLVRKLGLKRKDGRSDRQNEVWAGKPVNMAFKLASLANSDEILVSDRYHEFLQDELALKTCGCPNGDKVSLWEDVDLKDYEMFDFGLAKKLRSAWCKIHGREYCEKIAALDQVKR
jgi:class 3 adenylate cyclase